MSTHVITYQQLTKKVTYKKTRKRATIELSYCPFCGGEAEFRTGGNYNPRLGMRMGVGVRCTGCKAMTPTREGLDAHHRAASLWNGRARA